MPIYLAFIDFHKAFDSIEIPAILKALNNARIDTRYSYLLKYLYENSTIKVKINDELTTNQIKVKRGVRHGDTI